MPNTFTALLIDDHPLITESFKTGLERVFKLEERKLETLMAHNIDSVLEKLKDPKFLNKLNLIFLDISLPSNDENILSGTDLGSQIKTLSPKTKIIVSTSFNDNYRIYDILKRVDPEAFLVKNDIDPDVLILAIKTVLNNTPYYSKTVLEFFKKQINNEYILDNISRNLLYELSLGTKMTDLPGVLPLSKAGIEKRKFNLKKLFNVEGESDRSLIQIAKKKGII